MVAIEDAGWEIRDCLMWVYSSGFPKSLNISKSMDKVAGVEREIVGMTKAKGGENLNSLSRLTGNDNSTAKGCGAYGQGAKQITIDIPITVPATDAAKQWDGWGTALKPAYEIIILARKPLEGTVANNILKHGCGGINIDGCRIESDDAKEGRMRHGGGVVGNGSSYELPDSHGKMPAGRFPANLIHDGSDDVLELFPKTKHGNFDSAARFFYCAKASTRERNEGCDNLPTKTPGECNGRTDGSDGLNSPRAGAGRVGGAKNIHPTVKPIALCRYLCHLITPPNGIVLDPFAGSGSTGIAAKQEGFQSILIEKEKEYVDISNARIRGTK